MPKRTSIYLLVLLLISFPVVVSGSDYPVAGIKPSARPDSAPVVTKVDKNNEWYRQALTGIEPPYPSSLRFLDNQGNWYTPFTNPGMEGKYDLRHWHKASK